MFPRTTAGKPSCTARLTAQLHHHNTDSYTGLWGAITGGEGEQGGKQTGVVEGLRGQECVNFATEQAKCVAKQARQGT